MSGSPQKMLEHLLETQVMQVVGPNDPFLDDFLLTHIVFLPVPRLIDELANQYPFLRTRPSNPFQSHNVISLTVSNSSKFTFHSELADDSATQTQEDHEYLLTCKKRVVLFVQRWVGVIRNAVFEEPLAVEYIEDLAAEVEADPDLQEEASIIHNVLSQLSRYQEDKELNAGQKWKLPPNGQPICLFSGHPTYTRRMIRPDDDSKCRLMALLLRVEQKRIRNVRFSRFLSVIFRVYCADHTYCTLRFAVTSTAENIKTLAADKLQLNRAPDDLCLVEVRSNGERAVFKDNDVSIPTALSLNGRIFVSPKDHLDALVNKIRNIFIDIPRDMPRIPHHLDRYFLLFDFRRPSQSRRWWPPTE